MLKINPGAAETDDERRDAAAYRVKKCIVAPGRAGHGLQ
jgi:hypothetical protein